MKKDIVRKHGFKARSAVVERWLHIQHQTENIVETPTYAARLTTLVTFESGSRSYLWTTDRGRSRLIKH